MTNGEITGITPFFIVRSVPAALAFDRDKPGFEITFRGPEPNDIFFGIVKRDAAMIILKDVGVEGDDGLRGFAIQDTDGYVLYFGRPDRVTTSAPAAATAPAGRG